MSERNFVRPEGSLPPLEFIRPSKLFEDGVKGLILEGEFVGKVPNSFDESKSDFKFKTEDNRTVIINSSGSLAYRMRDIEPGTLLQVHYNGKEEIKSGKMKGKQAHNFDVLVAE